MEYGSRIRWAILAAGLWFCAWRGGQHVALLARVDQNPTGALDLADTQGSDSKSTATVAPSVDAAVQPLKPRVGPSVLAGDLADIGGSARRVVRAGADFVHLDVFDGNWIPGAFTFGPMVVKALRKHVPNAFLDAHLCVTFPDQYVEEMAEAGVNRLTAHVEALKDPVGMAERAHRLGMQAGLALAPQTPVDSRVLALARHFDVVLVMTVNPGFGGQKFLPEVLPKLQLLRATFPNKALEVDGGVNAETIGLAAAAGASEVVAGTSVFKAKNPSRMIKQLRRELQHGLEFNE